MYEEIKRYIEKSKSARERKNKNKFLAWLIYNKFQLWQEPITEEKLEDIIIKASDYDRHWSKVLEENPELRGSDYGDKQKVEQARQIESGYESGHYQNKKKLNTL